MHRKFVFGQRELRVDRIEPNTSQIGSGSRVEKPAKPELQRAVADTDCIRDLDHCQRKIEMAMHVVDRLLDVPRRHVSWTVELIDQPMGYVRDDQVQGGFRQQSVAFGERAMN